MNTAFFATRSISATARAGRLDVVEHPVFAHEVERSILERQREYVALDEILPADAVAVCDLAQFGDRLNALHTQNRPGPPHVSDGASRPRADVEHRFDPVKIHGGEHHAERKVVFVIGMHMHRVVSIGGFRVVLSLDLACGSVIHTVFVSSRVSRTYRHRSRTPVPGDKSRNTRRSLTINRASCSWINSRVSPFIAFMSLGEPFALRHG